MQSFTNHDAQAGPGSSHGRFDVRQRWMSRLHYLLGLYLLFFVWLYAGTGLLLNHSQWRFAEFWDSRQESAFDREIVPPSPGSDLAQARDIMEQLGIRGEIEWTATRDDANRLDFRVSRPGHIFEIKTDLAGKRARVQRIDLNAWGVLRILHSFTGARLDDTRNRRDWMLTRIWALSMDAVAVGLVLMVLSGFWLWHAARPKRRWGAVVLSLGFLSCALFCFGLRWLL
ncbi:MAG: hypothetical protein ACM3VT_18710 [Solirubrobacterales bacterium]